MKKIFLIGGMSESGKSTVGRYLDSKGIRRLKFVTYLRKVMEKEGVTGDFQKWNDQMEATRRDWLWKRFIEEFEKSLKEEKIEYCCVESLYRPEFGQFIKNSLNNATVIIVYVEIPLEIRLQRQITRQGLSSIEEAKAYLLPRDAKKKEWGTPKIREIADVVLDNSGTINELYRQIDEMIKKYCPNLYANRE